MKGLKIGNEVTISHQALAKSQFPEHGTAKRTLGTVFNRYLSSDRGSKEFLCVFQYFLFDFANNCRDDLLKKIIIHTGCVRSERRSLCTVAAAVAVVIDCPITVIARK